MGFKIQSHLSVWVFQLGLASSLLIASDFTWSPLRMQVDSCRLPGQSVTTYCPSTSYQAHIFCSGFSTQLCWCL